MVTRSTLSFCLICMLILSAILPSAFAADITARTDRANIGINESFTLVFEASGELDGEPDFSPLEQNFEILNQGQSNNISIVNGQVSRNQTWTLDLLPKTTGKLTVPAIAFGKDSSPELEMVISKNASNNKSPAQKIFLEAKADSDSVYVQQQLIYTLKLYSAVNLVDYQLGDIQINQQDAVVKPLGHDRQYSTTINNKTYLVLEKQVAVFPQSSGKLEFSPTLFAVTPSGNRQPGFFDFGPFNRGGQVIRGRSPAIEVEVKDAPANYSGRDWLPAESIEISESWSPNPPEFIVGEPVTRSIVLKANGLTAAQLPDMALNIPAELKQYPDQPNLQDEIKGDHIESTRTEKMALIPTRPGRFTLPALAIPWWNTRKQRQEVARLPERVIEIAGNGQPQPAGPQPDVAAAAGVSGGEPVTATPSTRGGIWPWIALFLALGWASTLLLWWYRSQFRTTGDSVGSVDTKRPDPSVPLRQLQRACSDNDARAAKQALLAWAAARWPGDALHNMGAIARRLNDDLALQLQILSDYLYKESSSDWQGSELWQTLQRWQKQDNAKGSTANPVLEPLHRI